MIFLVADTVSAADIHKNNISKVNVEKTLKDDSKELTAYVNKRINTPTIKSGSHSIHVEFNEKQLKKAKKGKIITKKLKDKIIVKTFTKQYKKVKVVRKFTCWYFKDNKLLMDKNYFKNYYKYQGLGYKIKGGWVGSKCILTATKFVKEPTGKFKYKWIKSRLRADLEYSSGGQRPKGFHITLYPSKFHKGLEYYRTFKAGLYVKPSFMKGLDLTG